MSRDLVVLACNEAYERITGIPASALLGQPFLQVCPAADASQRAALAHSLEQVRRQRHPHQIPALRFATESATASPGRFEERVCAVAHVPLLDERGELQGILHQTGDIAEPTRLDLAGEALARTVPAGSEVATAGATISTADEARRMLEFERERLQQLFQQAPGFICVLRGPQHVFELANDAYYQLVGHRPVLGCSVVGALPELVAQGFLSKLDRVYATGETFIGRAMPIQLQRVVGGPLEQRYIDLIYQPVRDAAGTISGIFVQGHDVTEAYELAQEVSYQAAHDALTGLYNRREFARQIQQLEALPGPHALLYMDLDHFKIINDRSGHAAGDALLLHVAKLLREHVGPDDVLARLGGDEFALILAGHGESAAVEKAHLLRRRIRDVPFSWGARRFGVTLSVGLAIFGTEGFPSFAKALSLADAACFLAKEKGRNRVQLSHPGDEDTSRQQSDMDWTSRILDCIREDRVVLYGQRLTAMQPGQDDVECTEILARLVDTDGTLVSPASFIPAAERFGLIHVLDRHIIRKAFSTLQNLPRNRRARTRYFINVSGTTMSKSDLSAYLRQLLVQYCDVRAANVCFEVTETAAISNLTQAASTAEELAAQGFSFALDDFGSGMSSFAYLDQLPVQYVKIDGAFIKGILTRPAGAAIVEAVSHVARAMGIKTVAESVETLNLLPHLQKLGIDYSQGFALHRPERL